METLDLIETWRHQYYIKMGIYEAYSKYREELQQKQLKVLVNDLLLN